MGTTDNTDKQHMRSALGHADTALKNGWIPVGAVFVKEGRIIAHGIKTGIPHPRFDHAEHNACYQALWSNQCPRDLEGVTVYSTLEPCTLCMAMLLTTRVSRVVYGLEDPYGGGAFILKAPELCARFKTVQPIVEVGLLREESRVKLARYFSDEKIRKSWGGLNNPLVQLALGKKP